MLNRFVFVMFLFVLTLGLVSCSKPVPINLVSEIEKLEDLKTPNLGFVTLFDSDMKETKFLTRESEKCKKEKDDKDNKDNKDKECIETETSFDIEINGSALKDNASEIKELTTITVLGLSEVRMKDMTYNSCKYITIDNQTQPDLSELICKVDENKEKLQTNFNTKTLKVLDKTLVEKLGKAAGIESKNIGLVVLNDYKTGRAEPFLGKDGYFSPQEVGSPLLFAIDPNDNEKKKITISSLNTWTVITYRQNPCRSCTVSGGKLTCIYVKDSSC